MARNRGFQNVFVEGDSKLVIDVIEGRSGIPWTIKNNIMDIRSLATIFQIISWKHVFREANFLAHAITSVGFSSPNILIWDCTIPSVAV